MNEDEKTTHFYFGTVDYCVFAAMLILSATSGTYFGYIRKQKPSSHTVLSRNENINSKKNKNDFGSSSMNEYLLGSRKLKPFPVSMSLIASYISGVTILGTPAEIYNYGSQYWLIVVPIFLMGIVVSTVYLPVFSSLKVSSSYEYLELRFSSSVRTVASVMFVIDEILFLPIIIYVPALAFNQVTGANLYLIGGIVCIVCIFYTIIGGIKAVVHTDAWQVMVMFLSVVVVTAIGTSAIGPTEIYKRAMDGGRLNFLNMSPSMYERHTFWSVLIGGFSYWTSFNSVNQTMVQRYMSLPNLKKARQSIAMFTVGISLFVSVCCYAGVLVYAEFYQCDPTASGLIKADDQLFPMYVMKIVGDIRGLPGLFIAGVFGAALSSLSVVLNSTAAVLLEDICKGCFNGKPNDKVAGFIVKGSILALGALAMLFLFVVEKLGGILGVATSLSAIAAGTTFGIFTLGMLVPWSNTYGALWGAVAGAIMSGWISFGSQAVVAAGQIIPQKLNSSVEACEAINATISNLMPHDESDVFPLYRLSFHWINPAGVLSVLIVGTIVSFLTGPRDLKTIDPELISPVIHRLLPTECFNNFGDRSNRQKDTGLVYLRAEQSDSVNVSTVVPVPNQVES
ncbi:sodium-coupled monocarboxylate transporter 2-like isoform X3 [Bradysia coprophila]|nr:sodium-coupled monocarboxylate transporter 2-like isoform X3 [Bradysia coprophila]XP_037038900.1 sodium-coupled monocarboxylate transporter 2-like isoform X3 [Bradysia coprophila]XP_037038901.1 sodium-coupled monocarboxylate transporter 2-like isoform X3 [Bradysia coprophila]XP_037038902.1 sodium-coupled monocarboxylate transporter 2-like isoform X3 [Bradysia coprophila]